MTKEQAAEKFINKYMNGRVDTMKMDGCKKYDTAEFLNLLSPLNRLIIPLAELSKKKLKIQNLETNYIPSISGKHIPFKH